MSIILEGKNKLQNKLVGIEDIINNPKDILQTSADEIKKATKEAVKNQKSPDFPVGVNNSGKWQPFKYSNGFNPPNMNEIFKRKEVEINIKEKKYIYQHYGTKAHSILPKNAKVLRFKIGTKVIYSKFANQAGLPPRAFFGYNKKSVDNIFNKIFNMFDKV